MNERIVERKEVGDYRITIFPDDYSRCPITDWDLVGCYLYEYDRTHRLSDDCNWKEVWGEYCDNRHSMKESLRVLIEEHCDFDSLWDYLKSGKMESVHLNYDRSDKEWKLSVYSHWIFDGKPRWNTISSITTDERKGKYWNIFEDLFHVLETQDLVEILNACGENIYVKEWGTSGYSQGDYVNGIVFVTKERYDKLCGRKDISWTEAAQQCIDDEVKCIGKWMWGDVVGYQLEKKVRFKKVYEVPEREDEDDYEWEEVDSCWGFYDDADEVIREVMAQHDIKEEDAA